MEAIADVTQIQGLVAERNRMAQTIETLEQAWRKMTDEKPEIYKVYHLIAYVQEGNSLMDAVEEVYGSEFQKSVL